MVRIPIPIKQPVQWKVRGFFSWLRWISDLNSKPFNENLNNELDKWFCQGQCFKVFYIQGLQKMVVFCCKHHFQGLNMIKGDGLFLCFLFVMKPQRTFFPQRVPGRSVDYLKETNGVLESPSLWCKIHSDSSCIIVSSSHILSNSWLW